MKRLFLLLIMAGFTAGAYAQATGSAAASATVVTPISITKTVDMSFGDVAVKSGQAGTVVLGTDDVRTESEFVTLPTTTTGTSASFTVSGGTDYTYAITLPTTVDITEAGTSQTMALSSFTSLPSGTGTLTAGTETLKVGATLTVVGGQVNAAYTGNFDVTVNYN